MWKLGRLWLLLRNELRLAWAVLRDPRAPLASKFTLVLALLFVASPVGLIADSVPVLGWFGEGLVALLLMKLALHFLPPELHRSLRDKLARRGAARRA